MAKTRLLGLLLTSAVLLASPALAVDGVVLIDHASALAGNVTPGDTPGYPVTLSLPGSYRLSGNLAPEGRVNGIDVTAPEVTIDFNGFRLHGFRASLGIYATQRNLTVRNGTIRGFNEHGIFAQGEGAIVEDMRISTNSIGVFINSIFARIVNNTITNNRAFGIRCGDSCHIEGNYVAGNQNGIQLSSGTILGNTIQANVNYGINDFDFGGTGYGNNTIVENGISVFGSSLNQLHPNHCSPAC